MSLVHGSFMCFCSFGFALCADSVCTHFEFPDTSAGAELWVELDMWQPHTHGRAHTPHTHTQTDTQREELGFILKALAAINF